MLPGNMNMDPIVRADLLYRQAGEVLEYLHLVEALHTCSARVQFTGSYFLNLMAYPDIDVEASQASLEQVFAVGARLARVPGVTQVVYEPSDDPRLPGGHYLKPRLHWGEWDRPWKVDIWFLDDQLIEQQHAEMLRSQSLLTPDLRRQILAYKNAMLNQEGRTPMGSGYWIYKAFLEEGLREHDQVTDYLEHKGIRVRR